MIALAALPALAALAAPLQDSARQVPADGTFAVDAKLPRLFVEGEPLELEVTVRSTSELPAEFPLWALTPSAVSLAGDRLGDRTEASFVLAPGQTLSTTIDLAPALADQEGHKLLLRHDLAGGDPVEVLRLERAEKGIDFMTLPAEQLGEYQVVMLTNAGDLWFELWPDVAPNHVRNFLDLSYTGFYDGSRFHRVIPTFMIQGGRSATGAAAPRKVNAEFSTRRHVPGVLSAARLGNDINSASSEFFVMHKAAPTLDGKYTPYGMLIESMETVENVVDGVDANYRLVKALQRVVPINPNQPMVGAVMNDPQPAQIILKALVVKTPKQ